ncbi:MAG: ribonuclease D, partial [Eggerthellaceae bacterium]|nr:ribonuclease D [Eggerthellaceae bacterium]
DIDSLFQVRGLKRHTSITDAREIVDAITTGLSKDKDQWPQTNDYAKSEQNVSDIIDLMLALVKYKSKQHNVAPQMIAGHNELVAFARGHIEESGLMDSWKADVIGNDLQKLLDGKLFLHIENGKIIMTDEQ